MSLVPIETEPLDTIVHGEEGNPIDPDIPFDIMSTGAALRPQGNIPNIVDSPLKTRLRRCSEEKCVGAYGKRKQKHSLREFQRALKDETDLNSEDSDMLANILSQRR